MDGTDSGGGYNYGSSYYGTDRGPCTVVDTRMVDEAAERVARVQDGAVDAGEGLRQLPVVGVALGADAMLDSLSDLGRQWLTHLDGAAGEAGALAEALRTARAHYDRTEHEAELASRSFLGATLAALCLGTS